MNSLESRDDARSFNNHYIIFYKGDQIIEVKYEHLFYIVNVLRGEGDI